MKNLFILFVIFFSFNPYLICAEDGKASGTGTDNGTTTSANLPNIPTPTPAPASTPAPTTSTLMSKCKNMSELVEKCINELEFDRRAQMTETKCCELRNVYSCVMIDIGRNCRVSEKEITEYISAVNCNSNICQTFSARDCLHRMINWTSALWTVFMIALGVCATIAFIRVRTIVFELPRANV